MTYVLPDTIYSMDGLTDKIFRESFDLFNYGTHIFRLSSLCIPVLYVDDVVVVLMVPVQFPSYFLLVM